MKKKWFHNITKWTLVVFILFTTFPLQTIVFAKEISVATFEELEAAIESANNGDTIILTADIGVKEQLRIDDKEITIRSDGNAIRVLKRGINEITGNANTYMLVTVGQNGSLILENITIDGTQLPSASSTNYTLIENMGNLVLGQGATLMNNDINVPKYSGGGAIFNSGNLLMKEGALITNCSHSYGGAAIGNEGSFIMEGGSIKENGYGSGYIYNYSDGGGDNTTFRMSGGEIQGSVDPQFEESLRGAVFNGGENIQMWIGNNAQVGEIGIDVSENHHLQVFEKLNKNISVYVDAQAKNGKIIAIGDQYTLSEEDKKHLVVNRGDLRLDTEQNAILLDLPNPTISDMALSTTTLGGDNHRLDVTITGKHLSSGMLVAAFYEGIKTEIEAYTNGNSDLNYATLTFPENNTSAAKEYTLKLSLDKGSTWEAIEKKVTVTSTPAKAYEDRNTYTYTTSSTAIIVEAIGDRQNELGVLPNDQRYIPVELELIRNDSPITTKFQYQNGSYTVALPVLPINTYDIRIHYSFQEFNGSDWEDKKIYTQHGSIQVNGIKRMETDKEVLSSYGENVEVTIHGLNIPFNLLIKAFDGDEVTDISAFRYTYIDSTTSKAWISLPENIERKSKTYTLKVSSDNGITWDSVEKEVVVSGRELKANPLNNTYQIEPGEVTTFTKIQVEAIGDRQHATEEESIPNDQRYIPVSCGPDTTQFQLVNGTYVAILSPFSAGRSFIEIRYTLEEFDGTSWQYAGEDIKYVPIDVMSIQDIQLDKDEIAYTGGEINVTITGGTLPKNILVKAFDEEEEQHIEVQVDQEHGYTGTVTIPANPQRTAKTYTIKASLDQGVHWEPIERVITVAPTPLFANAQNNHFQIKPSVVTTQTTIQIEAFGDHQNAMMDPIKEDERYIPIACNSIPFTLHENAYTAELPPFSAGEHTIEVLYELQRFDGVRWTSVGSDRKKQTIEVMDVQSIHADKTMLPYVGGRIQVFVQGEYLHHLLIGVFDEDGNIHSKQYASGSDHEYKTELSIPMNTQRSVKVYTIRVSLDDGSTWQNQEVQVQVAAQPIFADASKNTITMEPEILMDHTTATIEAIGDRQQEFGVVAGDQRYIPLHCTVMGHTLFFTKNEDRYRAEMRPLSSGKHMIEVVYGLEVYDGTKWILTETTDKKTKMMEVGKEEVNKVLSLNKTTLTLYANESAQLHYTLVPEEASDRIVWRSLDSNIAVVDETGNVHAKKKGTTYIQVFVDGQAYMAECEIIVLDKVHPQPPSNNGIVETGATASSWMQNYLVYSILLLILLAGHKSSKIR